MASVNISEIPAVRLRASFDNLLDEILPRINYWSQELSDLETLDEQFEYVCAITRDPNIAKDIFLLARQFQARNPDFSFPLALLWVYFTGKNLESNPNTVGWSVAKCAQIMGEQYEVGWSVWKAIKKGASSVYKKAKSVVKTVYKGGKAVFRKVKKGISQVLQLTKKGVFWAIRKVFGKKIGGFIVNAIELITGTAAKTTFGMLLATVKSLILLIKGKFKDAVNQLIQGINESILAPLLAPLAIALKINARQFKRVLAKAARKNKMLALQIVSLVFGGISGNVQAVITQAITIMRPIIMGLIQELKASPRTLKAVDAGLSLILMIVQGIGNFNQIMQSIAAKLRITNARAIERLKTNFRLAIRAISKFNLKDFIKYLMKAVSAPGMDQMKQAVSAPSVSRLMSMKPQEITRFMALSLQRKKGSQAINRALREASPKVIKQVIETTTRQNPQVIVDIIRGSKVQNQILDSLAEAA